MSNISITLGDPRRPEATALLQASHALMQQLFDPIDNHYLEISELCVPTIRFFVAQHEGKTLGCIALANKGSYAEIKSMFVQPAARGKGIADALLQHIENEARAQEFGEIKLETGDKLLAAQRLYQRHGFTICPPFGEYSASESSVFMTKSLA
jgi:putative acetyltransferase